MLDKTHYLREWDSIYVTVRGGRHGSCIWNPCNPNLHVILMDKGKITAPPKKNNKKTTKKKQQHKLVMENKLELALC